MLYLFIIFTTLFNLTMWVFLFALFKNLGMEVDINTKDIKILTEILHMMTDTKKEDKDNGEDSEVQEG